MFGDEARGHEVAGIRKEDDEAGGGEKGIGFVFGLGGVDGEAELAGRSGEGFHDGSGDGTVVGVVDNHVAPGEKLEGDDVELKHEEQTGE